MDCYKFEAGQIYLQQVKGVENCFKSLRAVKQNSLPKYHFTYHYAKYN
jgi:hypothetical protein